MVRGYSRLVGNFMVPSLLAVLILVTVGTGCKSTQKRSVILETVQSWTKTAEIPPKATIVNTLNVGNMFSRNMTVRFRADEKIIKTWLKNSPGIETAEKTKRLGRTVYEIQDTPVNIYISFAEVRIDWENDKVWIYTQRS